MSTKLDEKYMTDEEVCQLLEISADTLARWLATGPPKPSRADERAIDLRKVTRLRIGGSRRWQRDSLDKVLAL